LKSFILYTAARAGIFLACYGLIWLVFGQWIDWNSVSALYTALIAMVISSLIALATLQSMRADLSAEIAARADRAKAAHEARTKAEDDD
jgi:hypothetical protein